MSFPNKFCGKKRVLPRSLLQQLIVASGPGAEEDMTALLELLHSTGHTNLALRDGLNQSVDEQIPLSFYGLIGLKLFLTDVPYLSTCSLTV